MTCKEALALGRRAQRARAGAHLETCSDCRTKLDREERALVLARELFAIEVPDDHAERVARAALAAPPPMEVSWSALALPIAWRAAAVLNVAGAIALVWMMSHDPEPAAQPGSQAPEPASSARDGATFDVDELLDYEVRAVVANTLDLGDGGSP